MPAFRRPSSSNQEADNIEITIDDHRKGSTQTQEMMSFAEDEANDEDNQMLKDNDAINLAEQAEQ